MKIGFIGCGNMGGALLKAAVAAGYQAEILASDRDPARAAALGVQPASNVEIAKCADYIFLGVKPQVLDSVLAEIQPILENRSTRFVLISMAAAVGIAHICAQLGSEYPVLRIMPNMPASVGAGMILFDANPLVAPEEITEFQSILGESGILDRLPERLIDAGCALSGCGPAYVYLFAEAMADGGVECGLPRDKAALYAAQTLMGAAKMLLSGGQPGALKDAVCSPGGTTIAGVHALESGAFRATVMDAVVAAFEKNAQLR